MSCFYPKLAFYNNSIKQRIKWTTSDYYSNSFLGTPKHPLGPQWVPIPMPCGKCLDCNLKRSREMATRCVHEAKMHSEQNRSSCFVTLTYSPENLPPGNNFDFSHTDQFMRALRRKYKGIKSYGCAEYGDENGRAHYHLLLFGIFPKDAYHWRNSPNPRMSCPLYRSPQFEEFWPYGQIEIGHLTFQSSAYVCRYVMKKHRVSKEQTEAELKKFAEKAICISRRPGIGRTYIEKYWPEIYANSAVLIPGPNDTIVKARIPRYYDKVAEQLKVIDLDKIKAERILKAQENKADLTRERMAVKAIFKAEQIKSLKRSI